MVELEGSNALTIGSSRQANRCAVSPRVDPQRYGLKLQIHARHISPLPTSWGSLVLSAIIRDVEKLKVL